MPLSDRTKPVVQLHDFNDAGSLEVALLSLLLSLVCRSPLVAEAVDGK
jgi:hypothetical protein